MTHRANANAFTATTVAAFGAGSCAVFATMAHNVLLCVSVILAVVALLAILLVRAQQRP